MWPFTHFFRRDSVLSVNKSSVRRQTKRPMANHIRPQLEELEDRIVPSFADGNGAVITNLAVQNNGTQVVISFDGSLNAGPATTAANFSVQVPGANPEVITSSTSSVSITSATYNSATFQVTLNLGSPLAQGKVYRVFINGAGSADAGSPGLTDTKGNAIDGDYDDTASGNFYALLSWTTAGTPLNFTDSAGDQVTLSLSIGNPGQLEIWRALDGDFNATNLAMQAGLPAGAIQQLTVANGVLGQTTLTGSAAFANGNPNGNDVVVVPSLAGQGITFTNALPAYFQLTAPPLPTPPTPVVATSSNLPYTIQIQQVSANLPALQSPVTAQDNIAGSPFNGYWLMFGGRNNGLHTFNTTNNFPPDAQNENIYVVNPATWQTWTLAWSASDVSATTAQPLYSTNQQSFQEGNTLFTVGGYGDPDTGGGTFAPNYKTYDTLTALSVDGLITAVVNGGSVTAQSKLQQIPDSRLEVTGGEMKLIGNQAYLVVGQDFQGEYNFPPAPLPTQTYTDEIQSFQINYNGAVPGSLSITNYQAQNDQVNFRRRDYNLGDIIQSGLQPALEVYGGVFTPGAGTDPNAMQGYQTPIVVNGIGTTSVGQYQQFFSQYSAPNVGLYDATSQSMYTVFMGGISLYDYNFATGQLTQNTGLPFVDDVTTLMQGANGVTQEFEMPSQLPGLYGAEARFFATPGLPQYANGVLQLDQLNQPTTIGYMFGGIHSTVPITSNQATQTSATNALFRVVLAPTPPVTYAVAEIPGQGVSLYSSATGWKTITQAVATSLAVDANGDVVGEFPTFYGVWLYQNSTATWTNITQANASQVAIAGNGIVAAEFPTFYGVWRYQSATGWQNLSQANASSLSVDANGDVVGEFPTFYGVWLYQNATGWANLTQANASEVAVAGNGIVAAEFPSFNGVWRYESSMGWQNLTQANASSLSVDANGTLVAQFPNYYGVWLYSDASGWANINQANATTVAIADDGTVYGLFDQPQGIWTYRNSTGWVNITTAKASLLGTIG